MRIYILGMITMSSFVSLICLVMILTYTVDILNPESELKQNEYKEHISYEYYKQNEIKRNSDNKSTIDLTKLTEEEWQKRWELSKKLSLKQIVHASKSSLIATAITMICFSLILIIHIALYRRSKPVTLTI